MAQNRQIYFSEKDYQKIPYLLLVYFVTRLLRVSTYYFVLL